MKKLRLILAALLLLAGWQVQAAPPTMPLVGDGETVEDIYAPDLDSPLISYADQMTVNAIHYSDGGGLDALIDGDAGTWFHSSYGPTSTITDEEGNQQTINNLYPAEKHWIQFELDDPQTAIFFTWTIRNSAYNDTPDDVTILVTNTPDEAKSWTEAIHLTDMFSRYGSTSDMMGQEYTSPMITFDGAYRYVRMVVNRTFSRRTEGTYGQYFWNMAEMQLYPARLVDDPQERLNIALEPFYNLGMQMYGIQDEFKGDTPGFYGAEEVDAFMEVFERAIVAADAMPSQAPTNEEVDEMILQLRATYAALVASQIKLGTGYYRIISSNDAYYINQGVEKAMRPSDDGKWLRWGTYDPDDMAAIWRFTLLDNGNFTIQSMSTGTYIDYIDATSSHVPMVEEQTTEQIIASGTIGRFTIYNTKYNVPYHTESHNGGAGTEGYIVPWGNADEPNSVWYIYPVSDEEFERVKALSDDASIQRDYNAALLEANKAVMSSMEYVPYITTVSNDNDPSVSQLWSNALEHNEGSLENLIDGNTGNFFHSEWSTNAANSMTSDNHALFADLGTAAERFFWTFTPRNSAYLDIPLDVIVYGSNDISAWDDPSTWTEIEHPTSGFPTDVTMTYVSPEIRPATPYRYLKFEVLDTYMHRTNSNTGMHYFTMSEFQVYSYDYDKVHSQYVNAEGMKEAVDKLIAIKEELARKDKITRPDVNALQEAVKAVNDLYVDHTKLAQQLASLLPEAEKAYNDATETITKLIHDGSQFQANSKIREGSFNSILDGDFGSHFSTDWDDGAQNPDGTYGAKHHLQVDMGEPLTTAKLRLVGRNSYYFDMPQDIDLYVTNDDEIGSNVLSSSDDWTFLMNINEGLPGEPMLQWTSEDIDFGGHRYIRMVVNDTWMNTSGTMDRHDLQGMCFFTLAEFQLIREVDASEIQYAYVPDVKFWADRLAQLIAENQDKDKYDIWPRDIEAFEEALAKLDSSYVHNDELRAKIADARDMVAHAAVGTDFGYVPSQDIITTLAAAADAAEKVAYGHTLQPQMDAEVVKLTDAMATLESKVRMPEMNHWYNIVNAAKWSESISYDEEGNEVVTIVNGYCSGKAIATKDYAIGDPITFGYYDLENDDATYGDAANAFWRFVPIEGTDFVAIQNMATGHYVGPTKIVGDGDGRPVQSEEPYPYLIKYYGAGELLFFSQDSLNVNGSYVPLHAQERNGAPLVGWREEHGNASCWTLKEVLDTQVLTMPVQMNTVSIMSLPFDIPEDRSLSKLSAGDAHTYGLSAVVVNDDGTTTLELVEKEAIAAGEAFILTFGDFEDETAEHPTEDLFVPRPTEVDPLASVEANGLVSAIGGIDLEEEGLGYIRNNKVAATTERITTIPGLSGYIRASLCQPTGETADLVLTCGTQLSDAIRAITTDADKTFAGNENIYDLGGRRVIVPAKNGLYITRGRKVLVK